jgi:transcriptional regulator with XRE-family HTH domain
LREVPRSREISQERLALEAGFDRTYISLIERGISSPTIRKVYRIAQILEAAPSQIVSRKGHAGDTLRVDRIGRSEFVKAPAITIGLAVQPDVIRGLAEKPGFRGRGLLGRFLYALPVSLLGHRDPDAPPVPNEIRAAYYSNVTALLALPFGTDENGDPWPHLLHLSSDAQARMRDFEVWLEPQLSEFGELGGMTDWAGKARRHGGPDRRNSTYGPLRRHEGPLGIRHRERNR